ncbi:MAG: N-acyl amino acid synthase FeeM domain-containing protein, partial [Janthinobacterium lividum]
MEPDYLAGHDIDEERFNIRLANCAHSRESASLLIKKMYEWRGYTTHGPLVASPSTITLVAQTAGHTVGTMSLSLDTEDNLPADENFGDLLDELRLQKRRLCEPTKLAIEKNLSNRVFASMIHLSFIYAHNIHKHTDWIIEVNPRHVMFYKKMLGFEVLGQERMCTRVDAPAVLLRLDLKWMREQIQKCGGQYEQHGRNRTLYPYFFSPDDERGLTGRLLAG